MAIEKSEVTDSGHDGNYWKISDVSRINPIDGGFSALVDYRLYKDAAAYNDGLGDMRRIRRIPVEVVGDDPSLSDFEAAADAELLRKTIVAVKEVQFVAAEELVVATDILVGRPAVKEVKAVDAVMGVTGGHLEGGKIAER